jgi:hypothetical protein
MGLLSITLYAKLYLGVGHAISNFTDQFVQGILLPLVPHKVAFHELLFGGTALVRRHTPLVELRPHKARLLFILREKNGAVVVRAWSNTVVALE